MNENWKFSDIPYTRPDVDALQSRYNELTSRARRASCAEELLQIVRERDALQQEVGLLQSIITIRAFHDVTDGFYQTEFQETLPRLETLDSQSLSIAILENPYASALDEIFEKNPYMQSIYPGDTRSALEVFRLYEAAGEFFDIRDPAHIVRDSITIGKAAREAPGYYVGKGCTGCGTCISVCPQKCIDLSGAAAVIDQRHCLHCGRCAEVCPRQAIEKRL